MKQLALTIILLVAATTTRAEDTPLFIELPRGTLPAAVGGGGIVVGTLTTGGAFYWMPTTGVVYIGGTQGIAVSRDGRTIVGRARDARGRENAAIWQRAAEWRLLGSFTANAAACDDLLSGSFGASPDASIIVGLGWDGCNYAHGFSWRESTGMADLGTTVPGRSTRANAVSNEGRMTVGWQDAPTGLRQGARWVDGRQELFMGPHGVVGEALATNADGSLVVGQNCNFSNVLDQSAWSWTASTGVRCHPAPSVRVGPPLHRRDGRHERRWAGDWRLSQLRPGQRGGPVARRGGDLPEGLPPEQRRTGCLQRLDQHRLCQRRFARRSHDRGPGSGTERLPGLRGDPR